MPALSGIRVIEFGSGVPASYCGKLLAGMGADVIKVEPPEGDQLRTVGPFPGDAPHPEKSGLFLHLNTTKRSFVLEGSDAAARERYLAWADVAIYSGRPADLEAAGIDLAAIRDRFTHLVVANTSTFGLTGPYAGYLGGELIAYALGGYALLTGAPDRQPLKSYGHLVEYQAGAHAALGIVAALHAREVTGRGQLIDVSSMEAATFMLGAVEQSAYFYGRISRRNGTRLLGFPPEQPYPSTIRPCRDGYVHCHSNNRHRDLLGALIPNPRLLDEDIIATPMGLADDIDAVMDEWLIGRDRDEIVAAAQELRLPFTEVMAPGEVLTIEHHKLRGSFVDLQHPEAGSVLQPGFPFRMTGSPSVVRRAPLLGEHNAEALVLPGAPPRTPQQPPEGYKPLNGVRVLDFTNAVAGPIAGFILADLGADVIKVEGPAGRPRKAPHTAPLAEGGEDLPWNRIMNYNELNHGKRGVSLDVAKPEGRDLFLRLVEHADVVVQNFSPRVMFNLGIDYETLRAVNPRIVMLSIPAFGLDGPYRDRIAYGPGVDAMSGLAHLSGYADGPPMKPGNFFCDQQSGVLGALAVQAALWQRRTTGEGQHIELAMIEGEFQVLADAYLDYQWNGRERMRCGNDHPELAPHDTYQCEGEDAWVAIAVENDEQWQALCAVMGRDDLAADERFAHQPVRHANRELLRAEIEAWTATRSHYEAQEALQAAGVPAAAALNCLEILSDPHVVARHGFEYPHVPNVGPAPYPRVAFTLDETPVPIAKAAPGFGEDNHAVFGDLLGLPPAELARLEELGITPRIPAEHH